MGHVVLLGDSIFDNARYVPGGPSVVEHLGRALPRGWRATLLAQDGAVTADVARQVRSLPEGATHLVVSAGGNDALEQGGVLRNESPGSFRDALERLAEVHSHFRIDYGLMLRKVAGAGLPTAVCTVYDAVPGLERGDRAGLCVFNDVIVREAVRARLPVIDLRQVCAEPGDYSAVSPIEPSAAGGFKIAAAVARAVTNHDSGPGACRVSF